MRSISIPYIPEAREGSGIFIFQSTKENGKQINIDKNNWEDQFPYTPKVTAYLSYNEKGLVVYYCVECEGLRTMSPSDGNYVHEDSCVEFFTQKERGEAYINIEFNANSICYASHHSTVKESTPFTKDEYSQIERYSTIDEYGLDRSGLHKWELAFCVPWTILGYQKDEIPNKIYANLYKCGDKTSKPHFLSWNEIKNKENPAFHCPENFGEIVIEKP